MNQIQFSSRSVRTSIEVAVNLHHHEKQLSPFFLFDYTLLDSVDLFIKRMLAFYISL
jgi:hypothetical protein